MPTAYPSRVLSIDLARSRLSLSKELTDYLQWSLSDPDTLICQWISRGHFRVFRQTDPRIQAAIARANAAAQTQEHLAERVRWLQTAADAFRAVQIHPRDKNRLALGREIILSVLGVDDEAAPKEVYQQVGDDWIDVMTHEIRMVRLDEWVQDADTRIEEK